MAQESVPCRTVTSRRTPSRTTEYTEGPPSGPATASTSSPARRSLQEHSSKPTGIRRCCQTALETCTTVPSDTEDSRVPATHPSSRMSITLVAAVRR
ncbi:hypothetical protein GCM10020358_60040 [Amorphoplanes nipponensis]